MFSFSVSIICLVWTVIVDFFFVSAFRKYSNLWFSNFFCWVWKIIATFSCKQSRPLLIYYCSQVCFAWFPSLFFACYFCLLAAICMWILWRFWDVFCEGMRSRGCIFFAWMILLWRQCSILLCCLLSFVYYVHLLAISL